MKRINPKDVMITTKFNMDEISTMLEVLDHLIREVFKHPNSMYEVDFKNKVHSLRKDVQKMYGKAFDYKKEMESND